MGQNRNFEHRTDTPWSPVSRDLLSRIAQEVLNHIDGPHWDDYDERSVRRLPPRRYRRNPHTRAWMAGTSVFIAAVSLVALNWDKIHDTKKNSPAASGTVTNPKSPAVKTPTASATTRPVSTANTAAPGVVSILSDAPFLNFKTKALILDAFEYDVQPRAAKLLAETGQDAASASIGLLTNLAVNDSEFALIARNPSARVTVDVYAATVSKVFSYETCMNDLAKVVDHAIAEAPKLQSGTVSAADIAGGTNAYADQLAHPNGTTAPSAGAAAVSRSIYLYYISDADGQINFLTCDKSADTPSTVAQAAPPPVTAAT